MRYDQSKIDAKGVMTVINAQQIEKFIGWLRKERNMTRADLKIPGLRVWRLGYF
jgi:hypothetical protein